MIKKYSEFIFESLQVSKDILKSKLDSYERLKKFLDSNKNLGYMGKFTDFLFKGASYQDLVNVYNNLLYLKSKNIRIDISKYNKFEELLDKIIKETRIYKSKFIFNKFPKEQKNIIIEYEEDDEHHDFDGVSSETSLLLSKLYELDYSAFIKKISRYHEYDELINSLRRFIESKSNTFTKEYVKSILNDELKLVYEDKEIFILRVLDYDSIVKIASDTSWCLLNESTFKKYISDNQKQFVLIDYSKDEFELDFKIGFTLNKFNKITHAHNILDDECLEYLSELLNNNNIDVSSLLSGSNFDIIREITNKSNYGDIENAIGLIKNENEFIHILKILSEYINGLNGKYGYTYDYNKNNQFRLVSMLFSTWFNDIKKQIISEEMFSNYKSYFGSLFEEIKNKLIKNLIVIGNKPPNEDIFYIKIDILKKYYKSWNISFAKIEKLVDFLERIENYPEYIPYIEYYTNNKKDDINKLVKLYCFYLNCKKNNSGGAGASTIAKILIDNIYQKDKKSRSSKLDLHSPMQLYNLFDIKYHFDISNYGYAKSNNIISENIDLYNIGYELRRILPLLMNCNLTIHYTKKYFLEEINKNFKLSNGRITPRSDRKFFARVTGEIINPISQNLTRVNRKFDFSENVNFPLKYDVEYSILSDRNSKTKKISIVIE